MKRKIEDYKDQKVAIHCSTQEEWDKIVDVLPSGRSVKKIHWQQEINNGKSDTINIEGYGWSPKKHFENTGYTIYPASDFLEEESVNSLIKNEIYYNLPSNNIVRWKNPTGGNYLGNGCTIYKSDYGGNFRNNVKQYRLTTPEEKHWFLECEKANRFIPYDEAMKTFSKQKPFKFNIGDEIKAKPGGYYISDPKFFVESHKKQFPSSESRISGKITERTQAQGFNWYKCDYGGNWITEEGVELVKEDIPEYVEYIDTKYKGQIVKVEEWTNHSFCCIRFENGQREQPFKNLVKPSTKEAFDLQEIKPKVEMLPYPTDKKYFKAVVVKDILKKDIATKGDMPDLIPKGYQTWFRDVGTYHRGNIFQSSEYSVCPEDNRWRADIPAEYFEIVEEKESGMLVFGKYKVGDVVVSLEQKAPYRIVGDMFEVLKSNINALYYLHATCSLTSKEWRAATEEEIKAFQQGIKNVNDILKIGDYVVITKGTDNWSSKMNHYIGKVAKLTSCLSYDKNIFRIDLDNGDWEWQLKHNHFRKAKPDEIPLKQTTMNMQEIQQICKERYPIGCKYKCANFNSEYILLQDDCTYTIVNNEIWASYGKGCLYSNGKYAELISLPKSDWNPQIGDHVIIISPEEKINWVSGMDKYVGKLAKLTKKRENTSFEIDLDNALYVWDYKSDRKFFRKAEPHEISTISKSFEFFKEGNKVLIKDGCEYYHQGIDFIGEKMIGIISKVTSTSSDLPFTVKWSNGSQNSYGKEHLEYYVEMTSSKSISPTMLEIAKSKYPLGTFYIDSYERKQEVRGTLTIIKDIITDGCGGAVYEKGKWAKIVDALYNDNKSEQKTSTSENYPLTSTKSVTKKKREITLVPLIQPKTVKVFDREENFF